ncbi:hypothetical protein SK128_020097 [Halocaridina rubra]|uniref:Nephrin/kirre n=1 Tax=Halocaridina rubra TaxID=373956 RepID=A0AAN8WX55_HALRR
MDKPVAKLSLGRNLVPRNLKEGNDIFFQCHVDANPPPYKILWLHQDKELLHNASEGVLVSESTLALQQVQRSRSGDYKCLASNVEGDSHSNTVHINIKYYPRCATPASVRGLIPMAPANITCSVDADPTNVTFTWSFIHSLQKDKSEELSSKRYTQRGLRSTLYYTPMSEKDYGTLLCSASNEVGTQREPCSFTIISAGPPEAVGNCTTGNVTSHSVHITCSPPGFDGGLQQSFLLQVWKLQSGELALNLSSKRPLFEARPLDSGHVFRAQVVAFNSRGRSSPKTLIFRTLKKAEMHKSLPSQVEPPPLVLINGAIAGVALIIAATFVALFSWVKIYRKKRRSRNHKRNGPLTHIGSKDNNPDLICE